jgi:glycosyltransferase involved in cell wall biosynthesis
MRIMEGSTPATGLGQLVTIVIVPRERFSTAPASLAQVLSMTPGDVPVICVEGNPPAAVRRALHESGDDRTRFIASDHYLSPNRARNIGFAEVHTRYVAFLDNDVWVEAGWLEALVTCAEEEQAAAVGPLYRQGRREQPEVHMAGGLAHIETRNGRRRIRHSHLYQGKPLADVLPRIERGETEQIDFCMSVRARGGRIFLEPASQLTYTRPPPFALSDLRYFSLRWSEDWSQRTLDHFFEKWDLDRQQIPHLMTWTKKQRYRFLEPWYSRTTRWLAKRFGEERMVRVLRYTLYPVEGFLNRGANLLLGAGGQRREESAGRRP